MEKDARPSVKEVIVVEGRDDTAALLRAVDCTTIETHGFGISEATWKELEAANERFGLIIFTDPDHAGEEIRKRVSARFPNAAQAYLTRDVAEKKGDIGVENAEPADILDALSKARFSPAEKESDLGMEDMFNFGLAGGAASAKKRQALAKELGIGYGNAKAFLTKLKKYGVSREELKKHEALFSGDR